MNIRKLFWIILGLSALVLGAIGTLVPMLPVFPFLLVAAFSFGKSSEHLHAWFIGTKLYKDNLESYMEGKGMTWKAKIRIIVMATVIMGFGIVMMFRKALYLPCGILGLVWIIHIIYFGFIVKTSTKL